jgi:hypothetical protein
VDKTERAQELFEQGNHRAAIQILKPSAIRDRPPFDHRRALAELYRDLGCPDQAGRWGIVLDGWTTARERDRLARLLAASGVERRWLRAFLAVPTDLADSPDLTAVLEVLVPEYRTKMRTRVSYPVERTTKGSERARNIAAAFGGVAIIGCVVALLIVYGIALLGSDGAQFWAAAVGTLILILAGVGLGALGWAHVLELNRGRGVLYLIAGAGLVALGLLAQAAIGNP